MEQLGENRENFKESEAGEEPSLLLSTDLNSIQLILLARVPFRQDSVDQASLVSEFSSKLDFNNYLQPEESDLEYLRESPSLFVINQEGGTGSINSDRMERVETLITEEGNDEDRDEWGRRQHRKRSVDGTTLLLREVQSIRTELSGQSQRASSSQRLILEKLEDLGDDLQGYGLNSPVYVSPSSMPTIP